MSISYDNADRLTSVTPPGGGPISYTFDNNGNQTAAEGTTFTYDYADRLKTVTVGGTTETYGYAGDGLRLSASTGAAPGQTTQSGWDRVFGLPQLVLERDGSGALLRAYRYGSDLLTQTAGATTYTYHPDGLGSVADVTDSAGASLTWSEYDPYGAVRLGGSGAGAPAANPFAFSGEQRDGLSGLYHLRARQYDPATGRFLTTDPLAAPITDPYVASYAYVRDRPTGWVDPSGECLQFLGLGFAAALVTGGTSVLAGAGGTAICAAVGAVVLTVAAVGAIVAGSAAGEALADAAKPKSGPIFGPSGWPPAHYPNEIDQAHPDLNRDLVGRQSGFNMCRTTRCKLAYGILAASLIWQLLQPPKVRGAASGTSK